MQYFGQFMTHRDPIFRPRLLTLMPKEQHRWRNKNVFFSFVCRIFDPYQRKCVLSFLKVGTLCNFPWDHKYTNKNTQIHKYKFTICKRLEHSRSGGIFGNKRHITVCWGHSAAYIAHCCRISQIWKQKYQIEILRKFFFYWNIDWFLRRVSLFPLCLCALMFLLVVSIDL